MLHSYTAYVKPSLSCILTVGALNMRILESMLRPMLQLKRTGYQMAACTLTCSIVCSQQPPAPDQAPSTNEQSSQQDPQSERDSSGNNPDKGSSEGRGNDRGRGGNRQGGRNMQGGNGQGGKINGQGGGNRQGDRQGGGNGGGGGGSKLGNYTEPPPANNVPEHTFNVILGRPTDTSITVRVLFNRTAKAFVEYGTASDKYSRQTKSESFDPKVPMDFALTDLTPNTRHYYRIKYTTSSGEEQQSEEYTFHTQRMPGSSFAFTMQSDSHLDENTSGDVYLRTLANALSDQPDFHLELGDTFMTGKYVEPKLSEPQYYAQRYYLGHLCHSSSFFFALGNHDGESGSRGDMSWASKKRIQLFPNPFPDRFYTGNDQREAEVGLPENYYQWKWGDAQFIVLDPFRYTKQRGRNSNNWAWTLGNRQYHWLKSSLENVDAKYRFVFLHHLVGGSTTNNRGGIEVAPYWEWGGKGESGEEEFAKNRPGWEAPIHDLLRKHSVSAVFHGHDHLFIKQDLDGIVYQLVPQPGHARIGNTNSAKEYGYIAGETQSSSGHIRVRVSPEATRVDYVRAYLPENENKNRRNGEVSYSYEIRSNK